MNNKKKLSTKQLVILGLLSAIVIILSVIPFGTIPIGPLSITLNMIPVAIAAITAGPVGGLVVGGFFGLFSFLQAVGVGVPSGMGILCMTINPYLTFVQRFVSRLVTGWLLGVIYDAVRKHSKTSFSIFITGFLASLFNFIFFMGLLWLCFGSSPVFMDFINNTVGKATMWIYVGGTFVSNTLAEIAATTIITGAIGMGLKKANLLYLGRK